MVCLRLEPVFSDLGHFDTCTSPDDLRSMWKIITKAKDSISCGYRLENLSWRLWYTTVLAEKSQNMPAEDSKPVELPTEKNIDEEFVEIEKYVEPPVQKAPRKPSHCYSTIVEEICRNEPSLEILNKSAKSRKYKDSNCASSFSSTPTDENLMKTAKEMKQDETITHRDIPVKASRSFATINLSRSSKLPKKISRKNSHFDPYGEKDPDSEESTEDLNDQVPEIDIFVKDLDNPPPSLPPHRKSLLSLLLSTTPNNQKCGVGIDGTQSSTISTSLSSPTINEPLEIFAKESPKIPEISTPFMIWVPNPKMQRIHATSVLKDSLPLVLKYGWTEDAVKESCRLNGADFSHLFGNEKNVSKTLLEAFLEGGLTHITENISEDFKSLKTHEKIKSLCIKRLEYLEPYKSIWPEALALVMQKDNLSFGLQMHAELMNRIWNLAGDESVDFNWYTKRILLCYVYSTSELYLCQDSSENFQDTKDFLDRRLKEVAVIGITKDSLFKRFDFVKNVISPSSTTNFDWKQKIKK